MTGTCRFIDRNHGDRKCGMPEACYGSPEKATSSLAQFRDGQSALQNALHSGSALASAGLCQHRLLTLFCLSLHKAKP
jgi:hypothetical protein